MVQLSVVHLLIDEVLAFLALAVGTGCGLCSAVVPASLLLLGRTWLGEDVVVGLILLLLFIFLWSWLLVAPHKSIVLGLLLLTHQVVLVLLVLDLPLLLLSPSGKLCLCIDEARLLFGRLLLDCPLRLAFRHSLVRI